MNKCILYILIFALTVVAFGGICGRHGAWVCRKGKMEEDTVYYYTAVTYVTHYN